MDFSYKLGNVAITVTLENNSIMINKDNDVITIPYTEIKTIRIGRIADTNMLTIIPKFGKKVIISSIDNVNNTKNHILYQNFLKEFHSKLSFIPTIKYIRGNPFLFGLSLFGVILILTVFFVFMFSCNSIRLPSIATLIIGISAITFFLKNGRPKKYDPKKIFDLK